MEELENPQHAKVEIANRDIETAIKAENFEKVLELVNIYHDVNMSQALSTALEVGNVEIVDLLLKSEFVETTNEIHPMLFVAQQNYDEAKKIKIIELLFPFEYTKNLFPWYPEYFSPWEICDLLMACYDNNNAFLLDFLIHKFYSAKYNSLYPLIKKLQAVVDDSQRLCIFLHDDIECFEQLTNDYTFDRGPILTIFMHLIKKNTPQTMEVAAEVFKVLMKKNFNSAHFTINMDSFDRQKFFQDLNPLPTKRIFQFLYCVLDSDIEDEIFFLIRDYLEVFSLYHDHVNLLVEQFWQCTAPLLLKPTYLNRALNQFRDDDELQPIITKDFVTSTLKERCRNMIRSKILEEVNFNTKGFFQRVWSLNVPETLKCYLLRITDASWMNDLPTQ